MAFLMDVLSNLLASVILAALVALSVTTWSFVKFSGFVQSTRSRLMPIRPDHRVLRADAPCDVFTVNPETPFLCPIGPTEKGDLVDFYRFLNGARLFDGSAVRLDRLRASPQLSTVGFYDLIVTNLTAYPDNLAVKGVFRRLSALRRWFGVRTSIDLVRDKAVGVRGRPTSIQEALENRSMANALAVSVLLRDETNRVLIVRRSANVAVASGLFAASVSGTIACEDLDDAQPLERGARRELSEELSLFIADFDTSVILMPKQKMQPVAAFTGKLAGHWEGYRATVAQAKDAYEADGMYLLDLNDAKAVLSFVRSSGCSDTLAAQLWDLLCCKQSAEELARTWRGLRFRFFGKSMRFLTPFIQPSRREDATST